ncbi:MAG: acyl-CoA dehydratase activase [Desulfitobacteriaceae bacterium]|nr:acyl-CoA dehydratase activase [Desulfitobacteriaceae bacterium]MDD4751667.1 acyl-CoA dehydratase activase [Desulfitobacteriaceae bacterium]
MKGVYLGIDVGSVTTKIAAIDDQAGMVFTRYIRTNGQPLESVKQSLRELRNELGELNVLGVGTTGSGRQLVGIMVGADVVKNEITAHATATVFQYPKVRTIFEIGGQDSKIIVVQDGVVVDFAMNTVCAAGTGSFLDHQAERLKVPIEQFGELALKAKKDVRIAGRCTVFAESDMIAKQQFGFSKAEIIKGLCEALVRNYINNLGRGKRLEPPFVFQGGVAANQGIRAAFEKEMGCEIIVPNHAGNMGSIGVALIVRDYIQETGVPTKFRGFDVAELEFVPSSFECSGCSNHCEIVKVELNSKMIAAWGDRCGKWTNNTI